MLLENITSMMKYRFEVDDLHYKVEDISTEYRATISVTDGGHLQVGEFYSDFADGTVEIIESPNFPHTVERMRKSGNSHAIAIKLQIIADSILNN